MVRARNREETLGFYCDKLGLIETRRHENKSGRFTLIFLATPEDAKFSIDRENLTVSPTLEITWNWDDQTYSEGRNYWPKQTGSIQATSSWCGKSTSINQ